ncbi:MAG: hypothetical protein ACRENY_09220 [Candidatus Dormibacteria bacterium]
MSAGVLRSGGGRPRLPAVRLALLMGLLALAGCGAPGAPRSAAPHASAGTACRLTVSITTSGGTTWGTVTVTAAGRHFTFGRATRSVRVPCGASVSLSQRPTNSTVAPFRGWEVGGTPVASSVTSTVVNGAFLVRALYRPSVEPTASPTAATSAN